jgi:hypothetical protein
VRVASAHDEFLLRGTTVVLMDRGAPVETLDISELADRVLEGIESSMAVGLGILCAAVSAGLDVDAILPAAETLSLGPEWAASVILSGSGWSGVSLRVEGTTLLVEGRADVSGRSLRDAATVLPHLPLDVNRIVFEDDGPCGRHQLTGPLAPLRSRAEAGDDWEKLVHQVEALRTWEFDGNPLATHDHVRKLVGHLVGEAIGTGDFVQALRRLRVLLELARRLADVEMESVIAAVMGAIRDNALGAAPPDWDRPLQQVSAWTSLQVPPLDV